MEANKKLEHHRCLVYLDIKDIGTPGLPIFAQKTSAASNLECPIYEKISVTVKIQEGHLDAVHKLIQIKAMDLPPAKKCVNRTFDGCYFQNGIEYDNVGDQLQRLDRRLDELQREIEDQEFNLENAKI